MLIFDAYRMIGRTYRRLRRRRDAVPLTCDTRRSGLYSSPVGASLFTGALAAGINLLPTLCWHWDVFHAPWSASFALLVSLTVLSLGPFCNHPSACVLKRAIRFACFLTVVAVWPILAIHGRVYFLAANFYEINCVITVLVSALIGWHLARAYGTPQREYICALLGILGNSSKVAFDIYIAVLVRAHPRGGIEMSKEFIAFYVMAHLLGTVGVVAVPALLIEAELKSTARDAGPSP